MSTIKTRISDKNALEILKERFDSEIGSITSLPGGEMSQAFSFTSKGKNLVIRFYKEATSFEKDKYAHDHFGCEAVPIPKTHIIGRLDDRSLFFSITDKVEGKNLDLLDNETRIKLIPQEIEILHTLHNSKVEEKGYGWWDRNGFAKYSSWQENLYAKKEHVDSDFLKVNKQHPPEMKDIETVYNKMLELIPKMPNLHFLVHADYGMSNLMSDGIKITGVLDFGNSMYGDFLYDVAWLDFWLRDMNYKDHFQKFYYEKKVTVPDFETRILCYQLHMGMGILGFFIMSEQKDKYDLSKQRLFNLFQ